MERRLPRLKINHNGVLTTNFSGATLLSMRLNQLIATWRWAEKVPAHQVAKSIGISTATMCRIERGEKMDGVTLAKILVWLFSPWPSPKR